jgi:hypothetical protein
MNLKLFNTGLLINVLIQPFSDFPTFLPKSSVSIKLEFSISVIDKNFSYVTVGIYSGSNSIAASSRLKVFKCLKNKSGELSTASHTEQPIVSLQGILASLVLLKKSANCYAGSLQEIYCIS